MIPSRNYTSSLLILGCLATAVPGTGMAAEFGSSESGLGIRVVDRCVVYGPGYAEAGRIDSGHVACTRSHVRVEGATRNAAANSWTSSGTSSAALRSDNFGVLPGAGDSGHLRVRGGLENYNPFR